ncbi:D-alanyl-D-alanine carboxypeptidase family protein [Halomicronema sp. CCY15110]|uniref:M15 family metallopeptidase n=1 Tax=Halomicronema sp. CCY15110 TaxID=2767773 RepID=UPI002814FFAB|nr:D-alanyl-D-alanine carboxypeptidase family protein [Halomicronema sp. CCY15110]
MKPNFYDPAEDIPVAQRDGGSSASGRSLGRKGWRWWLLWFGVGLLSAIAGLAVSWVTYQETEAALPVPFEPMLVGSPAPGVGAMVGAEATPSRTSLLGHLAYEEAELSALVPLTLNGEILMQPEAAARFEAMVADANAAGISLLPISGFRTVADQQYLFFEIKAERGQTVSTRAEVSAPPGYSEHHTGYAIDIGDASQPQADLNVDFAATPAFQWLATNAPRYSFELSFPEGNAQGVQYEPWHWRFVGNSESLEMFYGDR